MNHLQAVLYLHLVSTHKFLHAWAVHAKQDNLIFQAAVFPANQISYTVILVSVWGLLHPTINTSGMIHHHGTSLSKQQTADLLLCHGTQQD